MPYSSMLYCAHLDSLASHREDLSGDFFHNILNPASCLHSLPPPRSTAVTSRLRSSQTFPKVHTRTQRYCSFILLLLTITSKPSCSTVLSVLLLVSFTIIYRTILHASVMPVTVFSCVSILLSLF